MAEKDTYLAIENANDQLEQAPETVKETHKLKSLRTGLRTMSILLKELEGQEHGPELADWLRNVREIAYETQEVIGSVVEEVNDQEKRSKLGRFLSKGKKCKHEEEIQGIQERIKSVRSFNRSATFNANEIVGFEDAQETLVNQIIDDTRSQLEAILIFGMAGYGKTTITKMVGSDKRVNNHFKPLVWVSCPQELPIEELLCRILRRISSSNDQIDHLDKDELKAKLSENLKGKRYLVVIDNNMQRSDELTELISCFPDDSKGNRIMVTSRVSQKESQLHQGFSFSYEVKPLDVNKSWQLLSRKVFEGEHHPDLENLGKEMAEKCKGSPKAILALAEILDGAEKTKEKWSKILEGGLYNYSDLSEEEQLRLLYFGIFPEGFHIPAKQIIQMWIAEGLLKQKGSNKAEEIGEQFLNRLIRDSFIQVGKRRADESVKSCYTYNHVHQFCKKEASKGKFFEVHTHIPSDPSKSKPQKDMVIRMANHSDLFTDFLETYGACSHAQSLHCHGRNSIRLVEFRRALNNFHHLLLLNCLPEIAKIPRELGKLTSLKYLKLNAPNVKRVPSSIVKLHKLETLDLRNSPIVSLPEGIWKLQLLRHLYLKGPTSLPKSQGIDYYRALPNLQTLSGAIPNKDLRWLMVRAKFPNVTKLRICSTTLELSYNFLNSLDHLYHLQSLRIENSTKLPDQNAFPVSLTKLTLSETELKPKYIKTLEKIPNLRVLKLLEKAICGDKIECSAGGFSQLEVLHVENLDVKELITRGAMQCVKRFIIKGCKKMEIPDDLRRIATDGECTVNSR